jgi:hypothetical protein
VERYHACNAAQVCPETGTRAKIYEFATDRMLRRALREYGAYFHQERNHQGLGNVLILPHASSKHRGGLVIRRPRLGGLLNYYERAAA